MDYRSYLNNLKDIDKIEDFSDIGLLSGLQEETPNDLHESIMNLVRQDREYSINQKYRNYINRINSSEEFNDEFEYGPLAGLEEEVPSELHDNIVKLIKQEKKKNSFNYKKYIPVAVAATVLISVLSFSNNIIRDKNIAQNITENNVSQGLQQGKEIAQEEEKNVGVSEYPDIAKKEVASVNKPNQIEMDNSNKQQPINNSKPVVKDNNKIVASNDKSKNTNKSKTETTELNTSKEKVQESIALGDNKTVQENTISGKDESSTAGISTKEEPVVMYSLAFSGQAFGEKTTARAFNNGTEINYELELNIDQIDIIDFVNSRGSIVSYRIYSLRREDENILNVLLSNNNVQKKVINEVNNNDNIIVKLSINGN